MIADKLRLQAQKARDEDSIHPSGWNVMHLQSPSWVVGRFQSATSYKSLSRSNLLAYNHPKLDFWTDLEPITHSSGLDGLDIMDGT